MRILKKASVFLFVIFAFWSVLVFAEVSESLPENFESYAESSTITSVTSGVFSLRDNNPLTILPAGGKDGSVGVKYKEDATAAKAIKTKTIAEWGDGDVIEFSFDLKASYPEYRDGAENTLATDNIYGGNPLIKIEYDETYGGIFKSAVSENVSAPYDENEWYRVIIKQTSGGKRSITIVDSQGSVVIEAEKDVATSKPIVAVFLRAKRTNLEIVMDNFLFVHYNPASNYPSVVGGNIQTGDTEIARNTEFFFDFDQEISASSVITIKKADGTIVVENITPERPLYNRLKVKLPQNVLLDRKCDYIIDLSGVTNGTLAVLENISFTTEDLHLWNDIYVSLVQENGDNSELTDITFSISDPFNYPTFSGFVMAAVFKDGKMLAVDMLQVQNLNTGVPITRSFSLGSVSDSIIEITLLDVANGPIPLGMGTTNN